VIGYGDEVVAAGQAQRLYDADPSKRVAICDRTGQPRWHDMWLGNPIIARPEDVAAGEDVQRVISGPDARPYIVYPFTKDTGWTFNKAFRCRDHIAKIYLTDEEEQFADSVLERHGPYVLIEPYTKHDNFRWPFHRWQQVISRCPELTFVQHMHPDSTPLPSAHHVAATFRKACALAAHADVYIRSESGLCHAAAAFGRRQVTIFGGCMDPEVMAGYPLQTVLADHGIGSPCGRWHPCAHCAGIIDRLTVDEVVSALRQQLRVPEEATARPPKRRSRQSVLEHA
jgi:hypothetical protein